MDYPVQASYLATPPFISKSLKFFEGHPFNEELTIEILKWISGPINNCAPVCKGWNSVIPDSLRQRFTMRMESFSSPICSLFATTHWPSRYLPLPQANNADRGTLFYIGKGISSFAPRYSHPGGCLQLSKRDLICSEAGSMSNDYVVLGSHQGTYFLQSSSNPDVLIITKDLRSPGQGKEISIKGLIFNGVEEVNGSWCLPLSDEKIVFLSFDASHNEMIVDTSKDEEPQILATASVLDLNLKTTTTRRLLSEGKEIENFPAEELRGGPPIQFGSYFIFNKSFIDLQNFTMTPHGFAFAGHEMDVCGSSLYVTGDIIGSDTIGSYFINPEGKLEKKWGSKQLKSHGDEKDIYIHRLQANDQFIALLCSVSNMEMATNPSSAFECIHLLDKEGMFLGEVRLPLGNLFADPVTMHLVNDVLIFNIPQKNCLNCWHIPTQQLINQFPWNGSRIVDIQSTNEEVVLLTSEQDAKKLMTFPMI